MMRKEYNDIELVQQMKEETAVDVNALPPRIIKHASKRSKMARYYSIALLWLFILLTAALIMWGYRMH